MSKRRSYLRKGIYSVELVTGLIPKLNDPVCGVIDGCQVKFNSQRYKVFAKSLVCAGCGLEAKFYALEQVEGEDTVFWHFNLYGLRKDGSEVLFTKDHILPRARGGKNCLPNYQTMCEPCNVKKGAALPEGVDGFKVLVGERKQEILALQNRLRINNKKLETQTELLDHLRTEIRLRQGAINAQDEREQAAASRIGMVHNCGWPNAVADEVEYLREELRKARQTIHEHEGNWRDAEAQVPKKIFERAAGTLRQAIIEMSAMLFRKDMDIRALSDTPLCANHAEAWFCERNHIEVKECLWCDLVKEATDAGKRADLAERMVVKAAEKRSWGIPWIRRHLIRKWMKTAAEELVIEDMNKPPALSIEIIDSSAHEETRVA